MRLLRSSKPTGLFSSTLARDISAPASAVFPREQQETSCRGAHRFWRARRADVLSLREVFRLFTCRFEQNLLTAALASRHHNF